MKTIDLSALRVVSAKDVEAAVKEGATEVALSSRAVVTPSARDMLRRHGCAVKGDGPSPSAGRPAPVAASAAHARLFGSPEVEAAKAEICAAGRKLCHRQYVDGNGGNISCRIGPNEVLCTPTLCSKYDLTARELCMVDLDSRGSRAEQHHAAFHHDHCPPFSDG